MVPKMYLKSSKCLKNGPECHVIFSSSIFDQNLDFLQKKKNEDIFDNFHPLDLGLVSNSTLISTLLNQDTKIDPKRVLLLMRKQILTWGHGKLEMKMTVTNCKSVLNLKNFH